MDPQAFDRLARTLAQGASRRRALRGLVGGALAAVAGTTPGVAKARHRHGGKGPHRRAQGADQGAARGPASAGTRAAQSGRGPEPAKCLALGKRCSQPSNGEGHPKAARKGKGKPPACSKCCSRFGAPDPNGKARCTCKGEGVSCDNDSQCCGGQCKSGSCTGCRGDAVFCTDSCADLQTNDHHCGSCDVACASGQQCVNGTCACPGDAVFCPDGCADLQTNQQHCGACENACAVGQRCVKGACACDEQSCPTGCCAGTSCKRGTSPSACGNDGAPCAICQPGDTCNDGTCACPSGVICTGSGCCASAAQVCDQNDQCCTKTTCAKAGKNCGTISDGCGGTLDCGTCSGLNTCGGGGTANVCGCTPTTTTCPAGQQCGSVPDGCGGSINCGTCPAGQQCDANGRCFCSPVGQDQTIPTNCDGICVDTNTDPNNCGACGATCPGNLPCNVGQDNPAPGKPIKNCCSLDGQPCGSDDDCCGCYDGSVERCICGGGGTCVQTDIG